LTKRQNIIVAKLIIVLVITAAAAFTMMNVKDFTNRKEGMRAMTQLGQRILEYRKTYGSLPPESYIEKIKKSLEGSVRLGTVQYRAIWITFDSKDDTILAYTQENYHSLFLKSGYIVLWLNGKVELIKAGRFENLLAGQQSLEEIKTTQK
jgi:type II secretory pathway pseudopilin PulG